MPSPQCQFQYLRLLQIGMIGCIYEFMRKPLSMQHKCVKQEQCSCVYYATALHNISFPYVALASPNHLICACGPITRPQVAAPFLGSKPLAATTLLPIGLFPVALYNDAITYTPQTSAYSLPQTLAQAKTDDLLHHKFDSTLLDSLTGLDMLQLTCCSQLSIARHTLDPSSSTWEAANLLVHWSAANH